MSLRAASGTLWRARSVGGGPTHLQRKPTLDNVRAFGSAGVEIAALLAVGYAPSGTYPPYALSSPLW